MNRGRGLHAAAGIATAMLAAMPGSAGAQSLNFLYNDTTLIPPAIPEGFDRDRNVAVTEHARPDYDPIGIPVSSFKLYPQISVSAGATSNAFLTNENRKSDGYVAIEPTARLESDWSRNKLVIQSGGDIEKYFHQSRRDQSSWNVGGNGEIEIGDSLKIAPEADVARQFESPYAGDTQSTTAVLSSYLTNFLSLRGTYENGRVRGVLSVDRTSFSFSDIDSGNGVETSQDYRNRKVVRGSGQAEYAFSPSVSAYAQLIYDRINYSSDLAGGPNRDSDGYRATAGLNFDLAGFLRGTIGAGYIRRNYDAAIFRPADGLSVEARLQYFPSDLTTFTVQLRRYLEDSSIGTNNPFFDNRVSVRVDHELLQNLLLNATASYGHVKYLDLDATRNNYRFVVGGQYMATRRYGLKGTLAYGKQTTGSADIGGRFEEFRGQLGFYVQI